MPWVTGATLDTLSDLISSHTIASSLPSWRLIKLISDCSKAYDTMFLSGPPLASEIHWRQAVSLVGF